MLKMKKLLPLLPILLLAGCYNAPATTLVEKPRPVGRAHGIDVATDAGQVARSIKDKPSNYLDIFGGPHQGVCLFAFCDGSVHPLSVNIDVTNLGRLAGRNDGQVITAQY